MVDVDMDAQIKFWAQELLTMSPEEQKEILGRMQKENPELAQAVVEAAQNQEKGKGKPKGKAVKRSANAKAMMQSLVSESKNPEELAQRLQMIDARQQTDVLREIQRANPQLFVKVMQAIKQMNDKSAGGGANVVDMRPLPDQKPPTRQEKSV